MIKFPADVRTKPDAVTFKSLETDQFAVNAFITSFLLIRKVDQLGLHLVRTCISFRSKDSLI